MKIILRVYILRLFIRNVNSVHFTGRRYSVLYITFHVVLTEVFYVRSDNTFSLLLFALSWSRHKNQSLIIDLISGKKSYARSYENGNRKASILTPCARTHSVLRSLPLERDLSTELITHSSLSLTENTWIVTEYESRTEAFALVWILASEDIDFAV